jgi:hypothetical protein
MWGSLCCARCNSIAGLDIYNSTSNFIENKQSLRICNHIERNRRPAVGLSCFQIDSGPKRWIISRGKVNGQELASDKSCLDDLQIERLDEGLWWANLAKRILWSRSLGREFDELSLAFPLPKLSVIDSLVEHNMQLWAKTKIKGSFGQNMINARLKPNIHRVRRAK